MLALGFGAAWVPAAQAAAQLTVSPTILELEAATGDKLTADITVSAGKDQAIVVELVHADFGFSGRDYQVMLIRDDAEETTAFSTRGWFSLPQRLYRIPAGTTKILPLKISVPKNTPGGTYLGAALLRVIPPNSATSNSQVQAVPETGPLVFIAVDGGAPPQPKLSRFEVPRLVSSGPIRPKIVVENEGDEFFTFEGKLQLRGPGKDAQTAVQRQFVVPGEPRTLRVSADAKGDDGAPKLGDEDLGMGRHVVEARLRIEPTGKTLVAKRTVWVIPTWARVLAALVAITLIACITLLVRWFLLRRRDRAAMNATELANGASGHAADDDERSLNPNDMDDDSLSAPYDDEQDEHSLSPQDEDSMSVDPADDASLD